MIFHHLLSADQALVLWMPLMPARFRRTQSLWAPALECLLYVLLHGQVWPNYLCSWLQQAFLPSGCYNLDLMHCTKYCTIVLFSIILPVVWQISASWKGLACRMATFRIKHCCVG